MDAYNFKDDVVEQTCTRCGNNFTRHRESEVFVCLSCYEDKIIKVRTRKDTITFALKMLLAVGLMAWAFFAWTSSKSGNKNTKLSGLVEALAAAGVGVWVGRSAWKTFKKTKGARRR